MKRGVLLVVVFSFIFVASLSLLNAGCDSGYSQCSGYPDFHHNSDQTQSQCQASLNSACGGVGFHYSCYQSNVCSWCCNLGNNCDENDWGAWSTCSVSCGGGTQSRTNDCDDTQTQSCNTQACCTESTWYLDADDDGWYVTTTLACTRPNSNWKPHSEINIAHSGDCNDNNNLINPNMIELCGNTIDENCDGVICMTFINKPLWQNLIGQNITISNTGDTVLMYVPGIGFAQPINYTIYQNITGASVWQRFLNWLTRNTGLEYQTSTIGLQLWQTSFGKFYFEATIFNSTWTASNYSDTLEVSGNGDANPVAIILSPSYGEKFSSNSLMSFTHESYDEDDLLNITWDFGDGNITSFYNYSLALTPGLGNVLHTYTDNGVYNIKLTAKEMTREKFSTDMRTIYIFNEGINVFPVISNPQNGIGYGNWVLFNASASFVANCTYGVMPAAYFSAGNLNCSYLHAPNTASITGNYEIILNWAVYTGSTLSLVKTGNWSINYNGAVVFNHFFLNPARHDARLDINYFKK